jgi:multicomponent Na+:H+ antiporter subunit E
VRQSSARAGYARGPCRLLFERGMTGNMSSVRPTAFRAAALFALWLALARWSIADIAVGLVVATLASWASFSVLPLRSHRRQSILAMAELVLRFPMQSFLAGLDVARRAFDPRLPLRPGFVVCPMRLRQDTARNAFRVLMSLQPGSLPVGEDSSGALLVHCLDTGKPLIASFIEEELLFAEAVGAEVDRG